MSGQSAHDWGSTLLSFQRHGSNNGMNQEPPFIRGPLNGLEPCQGLLPF